MRAETRIVTAESFSWTDSLRDILDYREMLFILVWRELKLRYKQTVIGVLWAVLQPLFTMLVFTVFFGLLARIPAGGLPYPIFYLSGLLVWSYFAYIVQNATQSVIDHQMLFTRIFFPRIYLPLTPALSGLTNLAITGILFIILLLAYGFSLTATILFLPFFIAQAMIAGLGAGFWLAALNARFRDIRYAVPFLIQLWMFASPVIYPTSMVPPGLRTLYAINPMVGAIEGIRWCVVGGGLELSALAVSASIAALLFLSGFVFFLRTEDTLADII